MISGFLQFGYLGLLGMLIYLCYRIIDRSKENNRTFNQTLVILFLFSILSIIGGGAGYIWASKELEVAKANQSTASIIKQQIESSQLAHANSMLPLQQALDGAVKSLNSSVLNSTRKEHLAEINELNTAIQIRQNLHNTELEAIRNLFEIPKDK